MGIQILNCNDLGRIRITRKSDKRTDSASENTHELSYGSIGIDMQKEINNMLTFMVPLFKT